MDFRQGAGAMSSDWCCSRQSTDWRSVNKLEFFKWKIRTRTKEEEQGRAAWNKSAHRSPRGLVSRSNATPCCGVWKDINGMSTGQWHHNSAIVRARLFVESIWSCSRQRQASQKLHTFCFLRPIREDCGQGAGACSPKHNREESAHGA